MTTLMRASRLLCALPLLLAACRTTPPDNAPPTLNSALSSANLEASVAAGSLANAYDFFTNATSEGILTNPDNLQTVTVDGSGETGLLTLEPASTQTPGIYELGLSATNDTDNSKPTVTTNNLFIVNVLPAGQPTNPTIVDFAMNGATTQTATVTLFTLRNGITNASQNLQLLLPNGSSAASSGVTVSNITPVAAGTNSAAIQATLTVDTSKLVTSTATDNQNNTYSNGILLEFTANTVARGAVRVLGVEATVVLVGQPVHIVEHGEGGHQKDQQVVHPVMPGQRGMDGEQGDEHEQEPGHDLRLLPAGMVGVEGGAEQQVEGVLGAAHQAAVAAGPA